MKKSNFKEICHKYTPTRIAEFFDVERTYIHRLMNRGYAPTEWFYNLIQLTGGEYSLADLQSDVINHKTNSIPMVDAKQVNKFLQECSKSPHGVGKSRLPGEKRAG